MFESTSCPEENVFQSAANMSVAEPEQPRDPSISDQMSHSIRPASPGVVTCGPQADGRIVAGGGKPEMTAKTAIGKLWSWISGPSELPKDPPTAVSGVRG
jgi:hypothetical protein